MEVSFNKMLDIYENEVKRNTKNKKKVYLFDRFKMENITNICDVLSNNKYESLKYNIFLIKYPKYRVVMSQNISDKVINHYITRYMLMPKLEHYLDMRNVATRKFMGRDYGIKLIRKYLEYYKSKKNCYVLKMDIEKYFYNIDHLILKGMLKEELTSDEYHLLEVIIDSTNMEYVNKAIKLLKETELSKAKERINEIEKIPMYKYGKGLPIGNMSSQFLSIFYLHKLDHFIVHDLHLKHYVRYMDDFVIFSDNLEYLKEVKKIITDKLVRDYKLEVNKKKTQIVNIKNGFVFCGYRFRVIGKKSIITISRDTLKRVKNRVKEVKYLYQNNKISFASVFSSINTYRNGFKFTSSKKVERIVNRYFFG